MADNRYEGRVKWFNEKKGFGFIISTDENAGEGECFVHYKEIRGEGFKTLQENDVVTYLIEKGPKGMKAKDVIVVAG